ncbi:MAG: hypothetical protein J6B56_00010 [Clostridia bacterium]|nr:hypothetical protein [Clostridia bacterium]
MDNRSMDNYQKLEKSITLLEQVLMLLCRMKGSMDAVETIAFNRRGEFKVITGSKDSQSK